MKLMQKVLGNIYIVIARELTKKYETFYRGRLDMLLAEFEKKPVKGEMVILFNIKHKNLKNREFGI